MTTAYGGILPGANAPGNLPSMIVTIPPYAPFLSEVAGHRMVSGFRLNTVMPIKESHVDLLKRLQDVAGGKPVYVDLKSRQLRTTSYAVPPFTDVRISHEISVNLPVTAYFQGGKEPATLVGIDGKRLIFQEGPKRVVGPGEGINIPDQSLRIKGSLTDEDKRYSEACALANNPWIFLSFTQRAADRDEVLKIYPGAIVTEKIEDEVGLGYVSEMQPGTHSLMAARGDLFVEVQRPHHILRSLEMIVEKDPNAIAASRIFTSLSEGWNVSCSDITDVAYLLGAGYKRFMLGDEVCMQRDSVMRSLNLFEAIVMGRKT